MRQVGHGPIGLVSLQFREFGTPGGDGQTARADGPAAGDVQRRITDDENFFTAQFAAEAAAGPGLGDAGNFIAIFVVIAEAARIAAAHRSDSARSALTGGAIAIQWGGK